MNAPDLECVTHRELYRDTPSHGRFIPDAQWISDCSRFGWLALTQDVKILDAGPEREAIINSEVGIVILEPGDAVNYDVLSFIIRRMTWLRQINEESKPFVYRTSLRGRARRMPLMA